MGQTAIDSPVSVQAYLRGEREGDVRHEFVNGEVFGVVAASKAHNRICVNLVTALNSRTDNGGQTTFFSLIFFTAIVARNVVCDAPGQTGKR